jgi:hypothetical protein
LQKIESAVERLSDDTRNLIKAGWDKMLNGVGAQANDEEGRESERRIASGLAEEARADLGLNGEGSDLPNEGVTPTQVQKIERVLENLEQSLEAQLKNFHPRRGKTGLIDQLLERLDDLSPEALALLTIIASSHHLERKQYQRLAKNPSLAKAIRELRKEGFLVPLSGVPVYWLPPSMGKQIKAATLLMPEQDPNTNTEVRKELARIEYPDS